MGSNYGEQIWGARYDANRGSSYESGDTTNSLSQDMVRSWKENRRGVRNNTIYCIGTDSYLWGDRVSLGVC